MIFHSNTRFILPIIMVQAAHRTICPHLEGAAAHRPHFSSMLQKVACALDQNAARVIASISTHSIIRAHGSNRPCNQGLDTAQPSKKHKANPLCNSALLKAALPSLCGFEDRPIKREFHHPQKTRCQIALEDKHLDCQSVPDRQHPDHLWILSRLSHPCTNGHYIPGFQDR